MLFAATNQSGNLLFRACVTLRRILAARKRPARPRIRKAALVAAVFLASAHTLCGVETVPSTSLAVRPIYELGTSIRPPAGELPPDAATLHFAESPVIPAGTLSGRAWLDYAYFWQAPALYHRPLYFEEPNLERYGHTSRFLTQPFLSGAHFFSSVPALPFKMAIERPFTSRYTLGHGRPGSSGCWQQLP
jgi:hypothetical protein